MPSEEAPAPAKRASSGASRFFSSYYIANVLLIASYWLVHVWFFTHSNMKYSRLLDREGIIDRVSF